MNKGHLLRGFVIVALLVDATLIYLGDRSAVAAIRARVREQGGIGRAELRRMLDTELSPWAHTRAVRLIRETLDAAGAVLTRERSEQPRAERSQVNG